MVYTVAGTALPGLGLIAAKRRVAGWIILGLFLALLVTLAVWAALDLQGLVSAAVRPAVLRTLTVGLITLALFAQQPAHEPASADNQTLAFDKPLQSLARTFLDLLRGCEAKPTRASFRYERARDHMWRCLIE